MSSAKLLALQIAPEHAIIELDNEGGQARTLLGALPAAPDGLVIDHVQRRIYFSVMGERPDKGSELFPYADGAIYATDLGGSPPKKLFGHGTIVTPKQVTADFNAGLLYWCDREGMRIFRGRIDGTAQEVLLQTGVFPRDLNDIDRHCVGIALDLHKGHIYWTQKGPPDGGRGRIFRMGLAVPEGEAPDDRSDIELLIEGLPEPIDLLLDAEAGLLYWTDRGIGHGSNSLNRASVGDAGLFAHHVLATGLQEGIGLTIDPVTGRLFVADLGGNIWRSDPKDDFRLVKLAKFGPLTGIEYLHDA